MILCDDCKAKHATYHSIKKINGVSAEQHLCDDCRLKQLSKGFGQTDIGSLFAGFSSLFETPRRAVLRCSKCGATSEEFLSSGVVGCADCYSELEQAVAPVIQRVQSGTLHTGKSPSRRGTGLNTAREYERLSAELDKAIKTENFEEALVLRDKLRELRGE